MEPTWMNPDWTAGSRVHNWRTHVPENVQAIWRDFTAKQKEALFEWAERLANAEEWE